MIPPSTMPGKNWNPNAFDDRSLPRNKLSKERELEIDRAMAEQLPEALEKLKEKKLPAPASHMK